MLLDKQTMFSDAQSLIQNAGAFNSTNVIDLWNGAASLPAGPLGTPVNDEGRGQDVGVLVQIVDTFLAAGGAATLKAALVVADDDALAVNPVVLAESEAIAKADLVAGYRFRIPCCLPAGIAKRYLGVIYTIATNNGTAGKVTAALIMGKADSAPGVFK